MYERTCCLIDKWAQERERLTQRESERDQTKLIEINSRRTSVCMSVCVTARGMCEKTRPMTATAIKQTLAVVYMCTYIHILCGILECPSIFSSRGDFYVVLHLTHPAAKHDVLILALLFPLSFDPMYIHIYNAYKYIHIFEIITDQL